MVWARTDLANFYVPDTSGQRSNIKPDPQIPLDMAEYPVPDKPLTESGKGPPEDSEMTKLQSQKMLWVGEPGRGPEAKWPEGTPDKQAETIKHVILPYFVQKGLEGFARNFRVELFAEGTWN
jgi:hypothetical protein